MKRVASSARPTQDRIIHFVENAAQRKRNVRFKMGPIVRQVVPGDPEIKVSFWEVVWSSSFRSDHTQSGQNSGVPVPFAFSACRYGLRHKPILPITTSVEIRRSVRLRNRLVMRLNCRPRHYPRPNFAPKETQPIQHR